MSNSSDVLAYTKANKLSDNITYVVILENINESIYSLESYAFAGCKQYFAGIVLKLPFIFMQL